MFFSRAVSILPANIAKKILQHTAYALICELAMSLDSLKTFSIYNSIIYAILASSFFASIRKKTRAQHVRRKF